MTTTKQGAITQTNEKLRDLEKFTADKLIEEFGISPNHLMALINFWSGLESPEEFHLMVVTAMHCGAVFPDQAWGEAVKQNPNEWFAIMEDLAVMAFELK